MSQLATVSPWAPEPITSRAARTFPPERSAVLIRGVNLVNLGAHFMLLSILDEIYRRRPDVSVGIASPLSRAQFMQLRARPRRNLRRIPVAGALANAVARLLPDGVLRYLPQVFDHQVGLVLDASGFLYSDQWGARAMRRCARDLEGLARNGARIILLPQAFGPFENPECARMMRCILRAAERVYARDASSYEHLLRVAGPDLVGKVLRGPDLTLGHELTFPASDLGRDRVLIVPNCRMLDKLDEHRGRRYREVLHLMAAELIARGEKVAFLIHGQHDDRGIAEEVNACLPSPVPILETKHPIEGKRIVAGARFIISSRFHAVLAAFSCGVPCVALGWSHKYPELFAEGGVGELYLSDWSDADVIRVLDHLATPAQRRSVRTRLERWTAGHRVSLTELWDHVWTPAEEALP